MRKSRMHSELRHLPTMRSNAPVIIERAEMREEIACAREHRGWRRVEPPKRACIGHAPVREIQRERFKGREGVRANAHMIARDVRRFCRLAPDAEELIKVAMTKLALSARAYHRVLKIARTIADLDAAATLLAAHVAEAIQYRALDRHKVI